VPGLDIRVRRLRPRVQNLGEKKVLRVDGTERTPDTPLMVPGWCHRRVLVGGRMTNGDIASINRRRYRWTVLQ
jgi:hypothetical protein